MNIFFYKRIFLKDSKKTYFYNAYTLYSFRHIFIYSFSINEFKFAWISMINFELSLDEVERARQIAEIAINLDDMKLPELVR
ncbi:hypothetical protein PFTANZ_06330 [Plasmodium falciparum Tanzania (2000708)]|uniref:14-3-3 domain-containing protein n=1 Tax=Plasmodium falciparum Tanzania (2000708) TaxID=1036725 RepID=A0A024VXJ4_PLAFA|nr:hypothetical protein PFTANZ_06330 [Plasmodium falciparum Tanzania (2000708)]